MTNVGKFRYVVTLLASRDIHDVTNRNVPIHSESAKQRSRRTVVKLRSAFLNMDTDS